jgi:hypothetical protein
MYQLRFLGVFIGLLISSVSSAAQSPWRLGASFSNSGDLSRQTLSVDRAVTRTDTNVGYLGVEAWSESDWRTVTTDKADDLNNRGGLGLRLVQITPIKGTQDFSWVSQTGAGGIKTKDSQFGYLSFKQLIELKHDYGSEFIGIAWEIHQIGAVSMGKAERLSDVHGVFGFVFNL